jgi:hypothetical protein
MDRNDLRKVKFRTLSNQFFSNGWFHEWAQCGDQENGLEKFALEEDEKGKIYEVSTIDIRFAS